MGHVPEKPSKTELLAVFFILVGTAFAGKLFETENRPLSTKGIILALFSSLTYALYIIATGRVAKTGRWQSKSTIIMVGSSLSIFAVNSGTIISGNHFGGEFLLWAIFLAIAGTTIPTALFAAGISKIGSGISSILMTVELPVAILCARIVLKEQISPAQAAGLLIMAASIAAMNYYKSRK